ncbi:MAG: hypothetical protein MZV63_26690 [Marinilabiliales bacterium]|nr:hypothetical protein [Marinilabiliales bacterium]
MRAFDQGLEMSQAEVEKLFIDLHSSPQVKNVASLISKRLGRKLEPFDIWYDGFKPRSSILPEELDKTVMAKYPSRQAFEKDLPEILTRLGFNRDRALEITSHIAVDPFTRCRPCMGI